MTPIPLTRTATSTILITTTRTVTEPKESRKLFTHPMRYVEKQTTPEKCYFGANAVNRPPPRDRRPEKQNQVPERANQSDSNEVPQAATKI